MSFGEFLYPKNELYQYQMNFGWHVFIIFCVCFYNKERQRRLYFKRTWYVAAFSLINLDNDNEVSKLEFESFVILFALFGIYPGKLSTEMLDLLLEITVLLNGIKLYME